MPFTVIFFFYNDTFFSKSPTWDYVIHVDCTDNLPFSIQPWLQVTTTQSALLRSMSVTIFRIMSCTCSYEQFER